MEANPLYLLPPKEEPQKALRQLIWCHAVGSVLLQCHFSNTDSCFLRVNEPQAALLMQFNNTDCVNDDSQLDILTKSPILTYNQLFQALRVSDEELQAILRSLVDSDNPILDINSNSDNSIHIEGWSGYISLKPTDSFKLSVAFRSKLLGGFQETHPIMCSSIDFEYQINASTEYPLHSMGVNHLQNWRNELIDAAIVRVLKYAATHKSGEFAMKNKTSNVAISMDTLAFWI